MSSNPHTNTYYSKLCKHISGALCLRPPQVTSLNYFAILCDIISMKKNTNTTEQIIADNREAYDALPTKKDRDKLVRDKASELAAKFYEDELANAQKYFETLTSFERDFPSVCFALATGIGKTRLMGACIAYLRYKKGIKNFFVMAPNLTIYKKLKTDLGISSSEKYVFKGLDLFVNPPRIIDGDNYTDFRQGQFGTSDVVINIFNISKLNTDSKVINGATPRIKRLHEVLGESYFSYLQSLPDLCIFMDESHHYHSDKSFDVINDLRPVLGVELTATPLINKKSKKIPFKNVIYEYSLAHALNDEQYVKIPVVFTRENFYPEEYTPDQLDREKLNDGIRIHEDTKSDLEVYSRNFNKPIVKPFVLVVARDTNHSREIMSYIKSNDFFNGYYADKVIEINSAQNGAEKDDNIELLLSLEKPENKVEIVIHVNMLKEGWDVTNLYTIVPLRASASEILTEQTIGRGLRLPYGKRTNNDSIDRLSIVSHDKYENIINLANDPNSIVRKVYFINSNDINLNDSLETIEMPTIYDSLTMNHDFTAQISNFLEDSARKCKSSIPKENLDIISKLICSSASTKVTELRHQIKKFDDIKDPDMHKSVQSSVVDEIISQYPDIKSQIKNLPTIVDKVIDKYVQTLTSYVIPIPKTVVQPFNKIKHGFTDFKLNTSSMNWHPSGYTLIGTELKEGGNTFTHNPDNSSTLRVDSPENEIVRHIIVHDNVDYERCADLLYKLVKEVKEHFLSYLSKEDAIEVMYQRQTTIADIIYAQMMENFYKEGIEYQYTQISPFSRIETSFGIKIKSENIYDLRAKLPKGKISSKVFNGFKKSCHTLYKFDSNPEREFAIALENDSKVKKWMRPAPKQFNIYYGTDGTKRYEPDFIVETDIGIFMVEIKASNEIQNSTVIEKAHAALIYCRAVSEWNKKNGGKVWEYALISHDDVKTYSTFEYLINNRSNNEQLELKFENNRMIK